MSVIWDGATGTTAISNFPNAKVSGGLLKNQIDNDGSISTVLSFINTALAGNCVMTFASEPSSDEKTAVDALIALHTTTLIDTWDYTCGCGGPPILTTAQRDILFAVASGTLIWNSTTHRLESYNSAWDSHESDGNVITITNANSPYAVLSINRMINCDCTDGPITVNLIAAASAPNRSLTIKKIDGNENIVTIDGNLTEEIDYSLTRNIINQGDALTLETDKSNWWIK